MQSFVNPGRLAVVASLAIGLAVSARPESPGGVSPPPPAGRAMGIVGSASCSGRGCHGALEAKANDPNRSQSAYSIWFANDPHSRGYEVLTNERSKKIGESLGLNVATEPRCLACHTTPQAATPDSPWVAERLGGVGCEACHGPAQAWRVPHTAPEKWQAIKATHGSSTKVREEYGFVDLADPAVRTAVCAGCHIGAPADASRHLPLRDMNHDFIAAGHPRLSFEMTAFNDNMPRHWADKPSWPVLWHMTGLSVKSCPLRRLWRFWPTVPRMQRDRGRSFRS